MSFVSINILYNKIQCWKDFIYATVKKDQKIDKEHIITWKQMNLEIVLDILDLDISGFGVRM